TGVLSDAPRTAWAGGASEKFSASSGLYHRGWSSGRRWRSQPVTQTEEMLGQFLGDETFPVSWDSDVEKAFFWVYDHLHIPNPLSPMFFDIGGWWLSCDHMFRRFGTPFAVDWLAKNVNG